MFKVIKFNEPVKYNEALEMQKKAFDLVLNGEYDGILLVLEHNPVFTIGTGGGMENLLISKEELIERGFDIAEIKRGGNITYHGPGQIVAYPIFNLRKLKKDTHWYIDSLEDLVIDVLKEYDVIGGKNPKYRGVWVGVEKICAVGVAMRKWITYHGLAFNINVDKSHFDMINPCGIKEFGISSLTDYTAADKKEVEQKVIKSFENTFGIQLEETGKNILERDDNYGKA